jgi:putative hydrolase of the HAD superfamily
LPLPKSIFTNSTREHAERVLEILGVRRHFEHIFDIRVGGWITKPDPRVYEHVLTALGIRAEECLFVDDSAMNLEGAQALGLHTVQVVEGGGDKSAPGADYLISDLEMLENVLDDFTLPYQEEEQ